MKHKTKTRKTIAKRFKVTKNGKVLRGNLGLRHRKSHKQKRNYRSKKSSVALNTKQANTIKKVI